MLQIMVKITKYRHCHIDDILVFFVNFLPPSSRCNNALAISNISLANGQSLSHQKFHILVLLQNIPDNRISPKQTKLPPRFLAEIGIIQAWGFNLLRVLNPDHWPQQICWFLGIINPKTCLPWLCSKLHIKECALILLLVCWHDCWLLTRLCWQLKC